MYYFLDLVGWRSVYPQTDHATIWPSLSVHPTNCLLCCDNLLLWHSDAYTIRPGVFRPPWLWGGRFVTCDMTSTLLNCFVTSCPPFPEANFGRYVTCYLDPFVMSCRLCSVQSAFQRNVDVLSHDFGIHLWCYAGCSAKCGRFDTGHFCVHVYAQVRQPMDQSVVCHVKVSKNSRIFRKNGPFVTLGQNVTLKLDKKNADKMSQTWGQNITVRQLFLQWDSLSHCDKQSKFTRSEIHNFGWMDNPSTLRWNATADDLLGGCFVWVEISRGWYRGGCFVWVEMSLGRYMGGRIVKAPSHDV
jgi:hypothetical protein